MACLLSHLTLRWTCFEADTLLNNCNRIILKPTVSSINSSFSFSAFDVMVTLTRSSLPWVMHTWMSGANSLQTSRAWFWGTHKWAISAALLAGGVSRTVGSVLVFGPPLHRGIVRRSLRQSSWDGYSVCSGLFWDERWWSVGVVPADGVRPGLGSILQSCCRKWLPFYYGRVLPINSDHCCLQFTPCSLHLQLPKIHLEVHCLTQQLSFLFQGPHLAQQLW